MTNPSRRAFLRQSAAVAGATLASGLTIARSGHVAGGDTIKIALIGCGGRGTGAAANAMNTDGPTKLVAMADLFQNRLDTSLKLLTKRMVPQADFVPPERQRKGPSNSLIVSALPKTAQIDVPPERQFIGLDGFKKAIDCIAPGGVAILTTPPAFRPIHLEYAVAKGCHVFMEKAFAVDAPGIRRVLRAGEEAKKKNLKIAGGLECRHYQPLEEVIRQIHAAAIGEVITAWCYEIHGPVGFRFKNREPGMSEMAHQIRNYCNFTWLNGSFLVDWAIHNLDVCCWVKGAWPVSAQAQGGRQVRTDPDQMFDHFAVEYTFADGTRLMAQCRHMPRCWGFCGNAIHGATGSAVLGKMIGNPRIYKGHQQTPENLIWKYQGPPRNPWQVEHDLLFDAIRQDKPHNETERCAYAAMTAILGRMAAESGQVVTWEQALASNLELAPGLDQYTMDSEPPVAPGPDGRYPVAMPGVTKAF